MSEVQMYLQSFGPQHNGGPVEVRLVVTGPFDEQEYRRIFDLMKAGKKVRIVEADDVTD